MYHDIMRLRSSIIIYRERYRGFDGLDIERAGRVRSYQLVLLSGSPSASSFLLIFPSNAA